MICFLLIVTLKCKKVLYNRRGGCILQIFNFFIYFLTLNKKMLCIFCHRVRSFAHWKFNYLKILIDFKNLAQLYVYHYFNTTIICIAFNWNDENENALWRICRNVTFKKYIYILLNGWWKYTNLLYISCDQIVYYNNKLLFGNYSEIIFNIIHIFWPHQNL